MTQNERTGWAPRRPWLWMLVAVALSLGVFAACIAPTQPEAPVAAETDATPASPEEAAAPEDPAAAPPAEEAAAPEATPDPVAAELLSPAVPGDETYKGLPVGFTEDGLPYRGDPDAPLVMHEYSDYQCPFCSRYFVQTEPALDEAFVRSGDLRVVFHDMPLEELHPNAPAAHVASLCVGDQGAALYWQMHAELFRSAEEWGNAADPAPVFARLAEEVGADPAAYAACIEAGEKVALVEARVETALSRGFGGTPSFQFARAADGSVFQLVGAQPYDQFEGLVTAVLAGETPQTAQESAPEPQGIPVWATTEGWAPDPDRPGYNMAGDQYRGSLDAPLVVVEFSDFQCPYCKRHADETQPTLDEQYVDTGKVLWIFKHFPLNIHPQAPAAGVAAECAAEQGKFWEMKNLLFEDPGSWSIAEPQPVFSELAQRLELDMEAFDACSANPDVLARVDSDLNEGTSFVRGTPTFIILNGEQGSILPGALPLDRFAAILDEELASAEAN